jgi:hypothetical protein
MQDGFDLLPEHIKVSYYYYEGLLSLFQYRYKKADKSLNFALTSGNCKGDFKSRVMRYLVPLNILFGNYPDDKLLEEHNLSEYKGITQACKTGSLALFEQEIEKNEERFLKFGVYLVLEKLKNIVYRNFFLDFYEENKQSHLIKLDVITESYKKSLEENKSSHKLDIDEENIDIIGME